MKIDDKEMKIVEEEEENKAKTDSNEENVLNDIAAHLNVLTGHLHHEKIEKITEKKWRFVASVMDRLFFILSLTFVVLSFVTLNLANSNFYHFS